MCRFFLPSGTDTYVLVWWVINNCACTFIRLRTMIQVILISILYVLARMVFFRAHLLKKKKKKKKRSAITWCPPKKSLSLFLCVHRKTNSKHKAMKNKDKKAKTKLESHYARKRSGKKHLTFQKWHNFY